MASSIDRDVLVALYDAAGGPNWERKANWGSDAPLSDWHGVKANDQGRVVELDLSSNKLRGICGFPTDICRVALLLLFCDILELSQGFGEQE